MKRKIMFIFAVSIAAVVMLLFHENFYKYNINETINQIRETSLGNSCIDYDMLSKINEKTIAKVNDGKDISFEEYYLLAFEDYKNFNNAEAVEKFKRALSNAKKNSNSFARVSSGFFVNNISEEYVSEEDRFNMADNIFNNLTIDDWNEEIDSIMSYVLTIQNFNQGYEYSKGILEKVLENESRLNDEAVLNIKSNLSIVYVTQGNYAKALEKSLETIAKAQECGEDYFEAKAIADMGSIYLLLEDYDTAGELLKKSIDVNIDDSVTNAFVKSYAFVNLYDVCFGTNNYEEILNIKEMMVENSNFLDEKKKLEYAIYDNLLEANYNLKINNIELAEEYLKKTEEAIAKFEENTEVILDENIIGTDIYYNTIKGEFYRKRGDFDHALEYFTKALDFSEDNFVYKKSIIKSIIDIYYGKGEYEKAYQYTKKLEDEYEYEARLINKDYGEYSLEKYSYEVKMMQYSKQKINNIILLMVGVSVTVGILIYLYMKNKNLIDINRTDALTKAYSRSYFNEQYESLINSDKNFYTLIFDIDNFKGVNDKYGHVVGDKVLKGVVSAAKKAMNGNGKLYRYGGEEFVVIAEGMNEISVFKLAEDIRRNIEAVKWDEGMTITVSMGAAERKNEEGDPLTAADDRLYISKTSGKNKVTWKSA